LHVERLEERAVPAFNIVPYNFTMPGVGAFHATFENLLTGYFQGSFTDFKSKITDNVSGQLVHLQGSYDHIVSSVGARSRARSRRSWSGSTACSTRGRPRPRRSGARSPRRTPSTSPRCQCTGRSPSLSSPSASECGDGSAVPGKIEQCLVPTS